MTNANQQTDSGITARLISIPAAKDMQPGHAAAFTLEGQGIAVFNVEGTYYAIPKICSHRGGPLSEEAPRRRG